MNKVILVCTFITAFWNGLHARREPSESCIPHGLEFEHWEYLVLVHQVNFTVNRIGASFLTLPLIYGEPMSGPWYFTGLKDDKKYYMRWLSPAGRNASVGNFTDDICHFDIPYDGYFDESLKTAVLRAEGILETFKQFDTLYHWILAGKTMHVTEIRLRIRKIPVMYTAYPEITYSLPGILKSPAVVPCDFPNPADVLKNDTILEVYIRDPLTRNQEAYLLFRALSGADTNIFDAKQYTFDKSIYTDLNQTFFTWHGEPPTAMIAYNKTTGNNAGEYYCILLHRTDPNDVNTKSNYTAMETKHYLFELHYSLKMFDVYQYAKQPLWRGSILRHYEYDISKVVPFETTEATDMRTSPMCYFVCTGTHALPSEYDETSMAKYTECINTLCYPDVEHTTIENITLARIHLASYKNKTHNFLTDQYYTEVYNAYDVDNPTTLGEYEATQQWHGLAVVFHLDVPEKDEGEQKNVGRWTYWELESELPPDARSIQACLHEKSPLMHEFWQTRCLQTNYNDSTNSCIQLHLSEELKTENREPPQTFSRKFYRKNIWFDEEDQQLEYVLDYSMADGSHLDMLDCLPMYMYTRLNDTAKLLPFEVIAACSEMCHFCDGLRSRGSATERPNTIDKAPCMSAGVFFEVVWNCKCLRRCIYYSWLKLDTQKQESTCGFRVEGKFDVQYFAFKRYYFHPGYNQINLFKTDSLRESSNFLAEHQGTIHRLKHESAVFPCKFPSHLLLGDGSSHSDSKKLIVAFTYMAPGNEPYRWQKEIKLLEVGHQIDKRFSSRNFTITFSSNSPKFEHNIRAWYEDTELYVIIENVTQSHEGLYKCVVYYGDYLHDFTITTVLKVYEIDHYWNVHSEKQHFIFVEDGMPLAWRFTPMKDLNNALTPYLLDKSPRHPFPEEEPVLYLYRRFNGKEPDKDAQRHTGDSIPKVEISEEYQPVMLPDDFRIVNPPEGHTREFNFFLIKRFRGRFEKLRDLMHNRYWMLFETEGYMKERKLSTELSPKYFITLESWTNQLHNLRYEKLVHWQFKITLGSDGTVAGFQGVDPEDSTMCWAVCTAIGARGSFDECVEKHQCESVPARSLDFNNLLEEVAQGTQMVNENGETDIPITFYNAINRIDNDISLKPQVDEKQFAVYFSTGPTNKNPPNTGEGGAELLDSLIILTYGDEARQCSDRCDIPLSCISGHISKYLWTCYISCIEELKIQIDKEKKIPEKTIFKGRITQARLKADALSALRSIPTMDSLHYEKIGYVTVDIQPEDSELFRPDKCKPLWPFMENAFLYFWHRKRSFEWDKDMQMNETKDRFYLRNHYSPIFYYENRPEWDWAATTVDIPDIYRDTGLPHVEYIKISRFLRPLCDNLCLRPVQSCDFHGASNDYPCVTMCMKVFAFSFAPYPNDFCNFQFDNNDSSTTNIQYFTELKYNLRHIVWES